MTPSLRPLLAAALAAVSFGAAAQATFPDHPVSMLVPFAAGGPTDVVARMIAIPMGKSLGQTVTVENAVGAGGTIAATKTAGPRPTATRCSCTTWACPPRRRCTRSCSSTR
jgi:tripartite-type tricarboxylate transporter receptor subunit TctC